MKAGMMKVRVAIAIRDPMRVSFMAWWPLPWSRSSWPGRVDRAESSVGAPRKIDGMKSVKVWVIAVAVMKIIRMLGVRLVDARVRAVIAIRLMWIPGVRPVRVPERIPVIRGMIKFSIKD